MSRALALAVLLVAGSARAAACCASATSFGVGRLLAWETAAVGLSLAGTSSPGAWDLRGAWQDGRGVDRDARASLYGLLKLTERWSAWGRVPGLASQRVGGTVTEEGGGLGDAELGARWDVLQLGQIEDAPAVALTFGLGLPTGRTVTEAGGLLGAGATGRGLWAPTVGLALEQVAPPWFARLDVGLAALLPRAVADPGVRAQAQVSAGRELTSTVVASVAAGVSVEHFYSAFSSDAATAVEPSLQASLSWRFLTWWTVVASGSAGAFVPHLGLSTQGRLSASVALRRGFRW